MAIGSYDILGSVAANSIRVGPKPSPSDDLTDILLRMNENLDNLTSRLNGMKSLEPGMAKKFLGVLKEYRQCIDAIEAFQVSSYLYSNENVKYH